MHTWWLIGPTPLWLIAYFESFVKHDNNEKDCWGLIWSVASRTARACVHGWPVEDQTDCDSRNSSTWWVNTSRCVQIHKAFTVWIDWTVISCSTMWFMFRRSVRFITDAIFLVTSETSWRRDSTRAKKTTPTWGGLIYLYTEYMYVFWHVMFKRANRLISFKYTLHVKGNYGKYCQHKNSGALRMPVGRDQKTKREPAVKRLQWTGRKPTANLIKSICHRGNWGEPGVWRGFYLVSGEIYQK